MDERALSAVLRRLVCPRCHKRYAETDLLFMSTGDKGVELYLRCLRCKLRIRLGLPEPRRRQRVGQKKPSRRSRQTRSPVTQRDVEDVQRFLAAFGGNVDQLLKRMS